MSDGNRFVGETDEIEVEVVENGERTSMSVDEFLEREEQDEQPDVLGD